MVDKQVYTPLADSAPVHIEGAVAKGRVDDDEIMRVTVVLRASKPRDELIKKVQRMERTLPLSRPRLDTKEFEEVHSPDDNDVSQVIQFATAHNLTVVAESRQRHDVVLEGSVRSLNEAFGVRLRNYAYAGGTYVAHDEQVQVPEGLRHRILSVIGLHDLPEAELYFAGAAVAPCAYTPIEIADRYSFPTGLDGTGQRIAIISFGGGYHQEDLDHYFGKMLGLRQNPKVTWHSVADEMSAGPQNSPTPLRNLGRFMEDMNNSKMSFEGVVGEEECEYCLGRMISTFETTMDIQIAGAVAPGAAIDVLFANNDIRGWRAALQAAIGVPTATNEPADDLEPATVVSISWGKGEARNSNLFKEVVNDVLKQARDKQITVCVASGDFGSVGVDVNSGYQNKANVSFPASSPWVLACGGTSITEQLSEVVWNSPWKGKPLATGGGVSGFFKEKEWQQGCAVPPHHSFEKRLVWLNQERVHEKYGDTWNTFVGRGVPDVAANADPACGYQLYVGGVETVGGGTSAAAPLWAALVARMNEGLSKVAQELGIADECRLGFMNPLLYREDIAQTFRSIQAGDNKMPKAGHVPHFEAAARWDPCTGLGVPNGSTLLACLSRQEETL